jgi:hypothetical protein
MSVPGHSKPQRRDLTPVLHRLVSRHLNVGHDLARRERRKVATAELEVVDPTVLIPGILSKIRPSQLNLIGLVCVASPTAAPRQASVDESPVALSPVSLESRHAASHALNPRHRLLRASAGQHAGPNMSLVRRHHAAPPDDPKTWSAFGTVHLRLPFLRTGRNKGS